MTIEGVDLSYARPGGAAISAAGKRFVVRYLTGAGKALTAAEIADYHAHGLGIALVFESTKGRVLGGVPAGIADATNSVAACTKLGIPQTIPVYFAVDFDAQPGQQAAIDAYLRAAASVLGAARVGVYGGINVINRCHANGSAQWFWQTYAWSGGKVAPFIHLYQYHNGQKINGGAVDFCRAYRANYGQWPQPVAPSIAYRVAITGYTPLYSQPGGTRLGAVRLATYTCSRSKVGGLWWYRITGPTKSKNVGRSFKPNRHTKVSAT